MTAPHSALAQAVLAASLLAPEILVHVAAAARAGDRRQVQAELRRSCETACELLTRLETAEFEFAATPHREPVDSSAWTGRQ